MLKKLVAQLSPRTWTWQTWVVVGFVVIAALLRFWNFADTLQFQGDQGRDAIVVKKLIKDYDPVLIGPVTSTGNMYLGPLYYYFMAPFLLMTYPSPLGPAYAVAILSVITTLLMYTWGKELVGDRAALLATGFFAISTVAINYARFSWNPNPAPFFGLMTVWATYRACKKSLWYWILVAISIAVLIQLHYITLLTVPAAGLVWLSQAWPLFRQPAKKKATKDVRRIFIVATLISILVFLVSLAPLALFDIRHEYLNARSFTTLISGKEGQFVNGRQGNKVFKLISKIPVRTHQVVYDLSVGPNRLPSLLKLAAVILIFSWLALRKTHTEHQFAHRLLLAFLLVGIAGLSVYQESVYLHYILYLLPVTFLLLGVVIDESFRHPLTAGLALVFVGFYVGMNLTHLPLKDQGWKMADMERTADYLLSKIQPGEKYNIVSLTGTGDIEGQNYRYFLEASEKPPLPKERWGEVETLFIINEERKISKVTDSPIYEIVVFPNKSPAEVFRIPGDGPEITVLRKK